MSVNVEFLKIRYPPEFLPYAQSISITSSTAGLLELVDAYVPSEEQNRIVAWVKSIYMARLPDSELEWEIDNRVVAVNKVSAFPGRPIDVWRGAYNKLTIRLRYGSGVGPIDIPFAISIGGFRTSILQKILTFQELSDEEKELATKYGLFTMLSIRRLGPYNVEEDFDYVDEVEVEISSAHTIFRESVPSGWKIAILGITAEPTDSPSQCLLTIYRDEWKYEPVTTLDLFAMPGLEWLLPCRIISTKGIEVVADLPQPGTYYVRIRYAKSRITLYEKVMWGIKLTDVERRVAEKLKLWDWIKLGVKPMYMPVKLEMAPPMPTPKPPEVKPPTAPGPSPEEVEIEVIP